MLEYAQPLPPPVAVADVDVAGALEVGYARGRTLALTLALTLAQTLTPTLAPAPAPNPTLPLTRWALVTRAALGTVSWIRLVTTSSRYG